jgi:hypothetical protein
MCDHRVVLHRCVVREWCNPSGSTGATCLHAAARTRRAARAVQGDVVSVWQVLPGTPSAPPIPAQRVARFDDHCTRNCLLKNKLRQRYSRYIAQALQGGTIHVFCYPPLSNHALVPSPFRVEVRRSPRSHFALNSGPLQGQFAPCVPRRTVSLHPAQASQRPCEGPVSSPTTCWLHDTRQKSMPLRRREHQCRKATVMCNTFCVDSSGVLVPRHRREVCSLTRRVM